MGHGHAHGAHASRRVLSAALALTVAFGAVQVVAGVAFDSLALLADAVHNLADGGAIALALLAAWAAARPPTAQRTYGWMRLEILAALVNGLMLVGLSTLILWDALVRLRHPVDVQAGGVIVVGLAGMAANGLAVAVLLRGDREDLNLRGALLHAAADVAGSAAAAVGGVLVLVTGSNRADSAVAALISVLVLASAWSFVRRPLDVLLEAAPRGLATDEIGAAMAAVSGVRDVHDLHVWTVTSRLNSLSAHVVAAADVEPEALLHALQEVLRERFAITHSTIQIERERVALLSIHRPGCPEGPRPLAAPLGAGGHEHDHEHLH